MQVPANMELHNVSRTLEGRAARAVSGRRDGKKLFIGDLDLRVLVDRPVPISAEQFLAARDAIISECEQGMLEVRAPNGDVLDPRTCEVVRVLSVSDAAPRPQSWEAAQKATTMAAMAAAPALPDVGAGPVPAGPMPALAPLPGIDVAGAAAAAFGADEGDEEEVAPAPPPPPARGAAATVPEAPNARRRRS
jgi:hypothetical protein